MRGKKTRIGKKFPKKAASGAPDAALSAKEEENAGLEPDMEPELDGEIEGEIEKNANLPVKAETHEITERELGAVSSTDPLRRYMEEVKQYPLLSPEEEFNLAVELRDKGGIDAAKKLVSANLRLVVKIAFEYRSVYSNLLDLIQEGNIGLMKAVSRFDPAKGARLGYYASWWIRSYILKYILDNFRLVKIGTTQAQKKLFYHLLREKERIEAQGLLAGPKLLADRIGVREKDVVEMDQRLSSRGSEMPLDAPIEGLDGKVSHLDQLADGHEGADESLSRSQLIRMLERRMPEFRETLNEKERRILDDRLLSEDAKTLQEVADNYGLTRERARQIETKVIEKLRKFLSADGWPV
ncbi:MAG: hypothetical protein A2583_13215 [Bdellovibrionales bacterium RIFOXYD1_FULL_53_11]|nr:MAG: hypothetical protein A2583_13215 [Bdellovibrionales bacterium RIFOXYD1_FULL_53_11]